MKKLLASTGLHWLWLSVTVIFVDLGSKYFLLKNLSLEEKKYLLPFLNLYYVQNYGIAFGFLSDVGDWKYWLVSCATVSICAIFIFLMYYSDTAEKMVNISYGLILGGALGNLFDRWWHGFVIDMIDFSVGGWHFAVFNLADATICIGVFLIIIERYFFKSS